MSKYRTKIKTINSPIVTPLEEIINALGDIEPWELEQPQIVQLEQLEQFSTNQHHSFFRLNDDSLNIAVLITMLTGILVFTGSLYSQNNNYAITGLAITLAAFLLRAIIELIEDAMENNNRGYVYQSHYRSRR
ncbi:Uncharacterised protein [Legionella wadsworthii]|uniref:Uncharacterized protein n=1 Tax=Legionella wadsworthii TaxID=28088 RepID=A0A378M0G8_9GAMM|nr:hypothetical protein [Legionella wadsworthii]STY29821.1 Uncharacterised protein [Legionella wadsworthii]